MVTFFGSRANFWAMDVVLGYLAGLLTLINPCVLPVLPIVLATAIQAHRFGPVAVAAGMSASFVALGMLVSVAGRSLGITEETIAQAGAVLMIGFGLILLVPRFSSQFATATAGVASGADGQLDRIDRSGLQGQFLGGVLLGAVWSPCIGPTLGGAIALASTGENLGWAFLIMVFFALGVSSLIIGIGMGAQSAIRTRAQSLRALAQRAKPAMGVVFIAVGLMIVFGVHHMIEAWAVRNLPYWLQDLSVAL